jgi:hypothetical protein
VTSDHRIESPLYTRVEIVETYAAFLATPPCIYYIVCPIGTPRKTVSVQKNESGEDPRKTRPVSGPTQRGSDGGYGDASEFSMCSRRSSTVQWGESCWIEEVASLGDGRMLNEPESAPCERLSMSRPIWADELKKTWQIVA